MINQDRQAFVTEARSWIGTPYHLGGRIKGVGIDCATLIAEVLIAQGLAEREKLGVYSHDWFLHSEEDRYMLRLLRHSTKTLEGIAHRTQKIISGCIILTKTADSKVYNHGAIVTEYPMCIHAVHPKVEEINVSLHHMWSFHEIVAMDPFLKRV